MSAVAEQIGAAFGALLAGHQVGDHLVQTDHQAAHKAGPGRAGWKAMAGHVAGYTASQAVALAGLRAAGGRVPLGRALIGLTISAGTHAFIDRRWPVRRFQEATRSAAFVSAGAPRTIDTAVDEEHRDRHQDRHVHHVDLPASGIPGMYLSDQAAHVACCWVAALVIGGGRRG